MSLSSSFKRLCIRPKPTPLAITQVRAESTRPAGRYTARVDPAQAEKRRLEAEQGEENRAIERNFTRTWHAGEVYAPHDLSGAEARKWRVKKAPSTDAFDVLSLNPLDLYKNISVMNEYVTDMGRIRPRTQTGLRPVNQRRLSKAIRRAVALGLLPAVYRHPELIKLERSRSHNAPTDI